jgi:hypothetical protein
MQLDADVDAGAGAGDASSGSGRAPPTLAVAGIWGSEGEVAGRCFYVIILIFF